MKEKPTIEAEIVEPSQKAVAVVRQDGGAVGRAMTVDELHRNLEFIRDVMRREMRDGTDYGKVPGCGDKPSLLQPGAQKLLMTFNLTERVKKETLREFPGFHREYEFTVTVASQNGKEWDGVGTCSTLEAKYRYRKAERKCPKCGHATIIAENPKFLKPGQVAGWLCWKKKGGCGASFAPADPSIAGQPGGTTENENPADCWNTVRKMAFKRALVAAAINATNTSELWTQDIEDMGENVPAAPRTAEAPKAAPTPTPAPKPSPQVNGAPAKARVATQETLKWMIKGLLAEEGQPNRRIATEYFQKVGQILPSEVIEDLPLHYVPVTKAELNQLQNCVVNFEAGGDAVRAFDPHHDDSSPPPPPAAAAPTPDPKPDEAWRTFPMPFGKNAGTPLAELPKNYLFGLWANYTVETSYRGKPKRPETIAKDETFRAMLDLCGAHYQFTKSEDKPESEHPF